MKIPIKLFLYNTIFLASFLVIALELTLRVFPVKHNAWSQRNNSASRFKELDRLAASPNNLRIVVGDSFGGHMIGTKGNFFDSVFSCNTSADCNYINISQAG